MEKLASTGRKEENGLMFNCRNHAQPRRNGVGRVMLLILATCAELAGPVSAATCYVSLSGSHTEPYDTWDKAATNIQVAVAYACANFPTCDTVLVTDGTYSVTATAVISTNIRVQSVNGPETTFVRRGTTASIRVFQITPEAADALLAGFTISNGYTSTVV